MQNADIQSKLDVIVAPNQAVIDAANSIPALVDTATTAADAAGFARGQASIVLPLPTDPAAQYTQAQMDAAFAQAKAEQLAVDQPIIDGLNATIAAAPQQAALDLANQQIASLQTQIATLQADAVSMVAFKASELAKVQALETDFK